MSKICLSIILLLFPLGILAKQGLYSNEYWKANYSLADSIAASIPYSRNIFGISRALTDPLGSKVERYYAIYAWVAKNIAYDVKALKNKRRRTSDPLKVLTNKMAVCAGYSALFKEMCAQAGLECEIISGWAKNSYDDIGGKLNDESENGHAWVAILIDEEWYLCDPTWGAGGVSYKPTEFHFAFDDSYFCMPTRYFAEEHMPEDSKWLLGADRSKTDFVNDPVYDIYASKKDVKVKSPNGGFLYFEKGKKEKFTVQISDSVNHVSYRSKDKKLRGVLSVTTKGDNLIFEYLYQQYNPSLIFYVGNHRIEYAVKKKK